MKFEIKYLIGNVLRILRTNKVSIVVIASLFSVVLFTWIQPDRRIESTANILGTSIMMQAYESQLGTSPFLVVEIDGGEQVRASVPRGFFFKKGKAVEVSQVTWSDGRRSHSFVGYAE